MADPKEVAKAVSSMVNTFGNQNRKDFIEQMSVEHRTLQQQFTQLCMDWLSHCDGLRQSKQYDGRNEASMNIGNTLFDFMERKEISYNRKYKLPFI